MGYTAIFSFLVICGPAPGVTLDVWRLMANVQVDAYPKYAASALAGNALIRCAFSGGSTRRRSEPGSLLIRARIREAIFPLFGIQMVRI